MQQELETFSPFEYVVQRDVAAALFGTGAAEGEQAAETAPGGAVAGQRGDRDAVARDEAGGGDQAGDRCGVDGCSAGSREGRLPLHLLRVARAGAVGEAGIAFGRRFGRGPAGARRIGVGAAPGKLLELRVGANDAGDAVLVGYGDRAETEKSRTLDQFLGVGAAGEEGEVGRGIELGEHGGREYSLFVLVASRRSGGFAATSGRIRPQPLRDDPSRNRQNAGRVPGEAISLARTALGERHPRVSVNLSNLGVTVGLHGDFVAASELALRGLAIKMSLGLLDHPDTRRLPGDLLLYRHKTDQTGSGDELMQELSAEILEVERLMREWVAEDPENRDFGPPPFEVHKGQL